MVTLASVLQVSCFHVLIGGEREYPSAQLPSIFLSGRGFSRVPGSFLTSRSLSFSLRFSDGSKQARVSSDEAARRHKRGRKPEKPLLSHSSLFTSIKHLASSISFSQVNDKLYRKGATCITQFVLGLISAVLSGAVLWAHFRNSGSFSRGMRLIIEHRFAWTTLVPSVFVPLDQRSP